MHIGMLWFDNTPNTPLKTRIEKAVDYYRKKYHQEPNLCLIHPGTADVKKIVFGRLTIRAYQPVLPGHLWIGIEDKN
jgi:hypothetical protein